MKTSSLYELIKNVLGQFRPNGGQQKRQFVQSNCSELLISAFQGNCQSIFSLLGRHRDKLSSNIREI